MKTAAKKPAPPIKKNSNKRTVVLILLLLLTITIVTLMYRNHQNNVNEERAFQADKARFAAIESDMRKVYNLTTLTLGEPDKKDEGKNCTHTSGKYEKGDLYCGIFYEFGYAGKDNGEVDRQLQDLTAALKSDKEMQYKETIAFNDAHKRIVVLDQSDVSCNIDVKSFNELSTTLFGVSKDLSVAYFLSCDAQLKKPIYPLAE